MKSKFFYAAFLSLLFCACTENNQPTDRGGSISCDPATKTIMEPVEEFVVTLKSTAAWSATVDQTWVSLSPNSGQGDAFVTVKVNGGTAGTANVLFSNGKSTATLVITRETTPGSLSGEFSVSETTKVHFSQGNLQYVGTWQFAEHQWDYFGISQSDKHRDLFGWGTGNEPNKVSDDGHDYVIFTDWGTNAILNGGNTANLWRTLTKEEWGYLFHNRTNAATLFGLGSVKGVNGTILLPDNWTLPAGASFTASTTQGLVDKGGYYDNNNDNNYSHNSYTAEQWAVMEAAGAVFLPAAGSHSISGVLHYGSEGHYWSATPNGTEYAFILKFESDELRARGCSTTRNIRCSVRLVR